MPLKRPYWDAEVPLSVPESLDAVFFAGYEVPPISGAGELLGANDEWAIVKVTPPQWKDAWELYRVRRSNGERELLYEWGKGAGSDYFWLPDTAFVDGDGIVCSMRDGSYDFRQPSKCPKPLIFPWEAPRHQRCVVGGKLMGMNPTHIVLWDFIGHWIHVVERATWTVSAQIENEGRSPRVHLFLDGLFVVSRRGTGGERHLHCRAFSLDGRTLWETSAPLRPRSAS